jgi:hypothetical protein
MLAPRTEADGLPIIRIRVQQLPLARPFSLATIFGWFRARTRYVDTRPFVGAVERRVWGKGHNVRRRKYSGPPCLRYRGAGSRCR